jgi:cytochrome c-type biogenesis protein CcmE
MTSPRRRKVRLVVCLTLAVVLASGLIYTSFAASDPALTPSQILAQGKPGRVYQLTGTVVAGTIVDGRGGTLRAFRLADRANSRVSLLVNYSGTVPDAFEQGRELIVTGSVAHGAFLAQANSMITKCPSKYSPAPASS